MSSVTMAKWQSVLLSTFFISSLPNMFLYLVPVSWLTASKGSMINIQHIALAFASGGLLGDVLLHSIPHLLAPHSHAAATSEDHDVVTKFMNSVQDTVSMMNEEEGCNAHDSRSLVIGTLVLCGFLFFFTTERLITVYLQSPSCSHDNNFAIESESIVDGSQVEKTEVSNEDYNTLTVKQLRVICRARNIPVSGTKAVLVERCTLSTDPITFTDTSYSPDPAVDIAFYETLSASGWLNIAADFLHNFTDGLAIGASHASGDGKLALAATLSIFFHEVPHEIGDFTILIENGMR